MLKRNGEHTEEDIRKLSDAIRRRFPEYAEQIMDEFD
jgi:hypothetical protein